MSVLPIVPHHEVAPPRVLIERAERLAAELLADDPALRLSDAIARLAATELEAGPTLHIDDQAAISLLERFHSSAFLQDRARLRAGDGDFVVTCTEPDETFESYCQHDLDLGAVTWLRAQPLSDPVQVAAACWTDRQVRRKLVSALRAGELRYLHPCMGSATVWAVARLLQQASRSDLSVIAPPPGLCARVNDKGWFADVVGRLFGRRSVPRTLEVSNFSALASAVKSLLPGSRSLVIKIPDSAGGSGNLVLTPDEVASATVGGIRLRLKELLADWPWQPGERLLVGTWETRVRAAPSSQLWLPPQGSGPPIVEGIFEQHLEGAAREFSGSHPAQLPPHVIDELAERSWLIGRVFQRLGYVGRCSFDAILVEGPTAEAAPRLEFVECNGRWGGTSTPMTLVNRLRGDWQRAPYAASTCVAAGLERVRFADVLEFFRGDLFDARTQSGHLVFYGPHRPGAMSGIDVIVFGDSWDEVQHRAAIEIPRQLAVLVGKQDCAEPRQANHDFDRSSDDQPRRPAESLPR